MEKSGFIVVEFIDEEAVQVVPNSWLEENEGELYAYFPPFKATGKVRKRELPDKHNWPKYRIREFPKSYTESYDKAYKMSKRAEETSNLDSQEEQSVGKPRVPKTPARFQDDHYNAADDEGENIEPVQKKRKLQSFLPKAPAFTYHKSNNSKDSVKPTRGPSPGHTQTLFPVLQPRDSPPAFSSGQKALPERSPTPPGPTHLYRSKDSAVESFRLSVLMKLDTIIENQRQHTSLLQRLLISQPGTRDELEDVLPSAADTVEELDSLCSKATSDKEFRRKIIIYLSSLGGNGLKAHIRNMMKKVASNKVWSKYSFKGQRGKLPLQDLEIISLFIRAHQRYNPKVTASAVEDAIADLLRRTPHRKGGDKHKGARNLNPVPYNAEYMGHKIHLDQNEKLVMFGTTHVLAIDGFTSKIVSHSTMPIKNNILIYENVFRPAVISFSIWDQVRVDHGKEFLLTLFMQQQISAFRNNTDRLSYVQTNSTRNHRIERIWPEINNRVNYPIKAALVNLMDQEEINMEDDTVHFCVSNLTCQISSLGISRVVEAWNAHRIPGKGVPNTLAQSGCVKKITVDLLPHASEAADLYESETGSSLTRCSSFGKSPFSSEEDQAHAEGQFAQLYPDMNVLYENVVNHNPRPFQDAILHLIHLSRH